jgi:post-segregation antitoxin (ccd killing protein)
MPRLQVYLPDDLHDELKRRGLPASELLQIALRAELERQDALDETTRHLEGLASEVGEPTARQRTHADAIVRRVRERGLGQAG